MALSKQQDYWIHPNALSITLNYFGDPQLIQTSMLAGAVILAYEKNVIAYDAAHNFREWQLQAYPTQLTDTCKYYVHAELSRTGHTAMIIYSPTKRDLEGRTFIDGAWDTTTSDTSWFIYLGEISASVDANGATVERVWTDGLHTGTLATDQHRMEEAQGEWTQMFQLNSATGLIDFLKTVSSAVFNKLTIAKEFIFGGKTLTAVAGTTDTQDQTKVNDATLPTTGYTKKYVGDEIAALDDHFLIKDDADVEQSVAGPVTFEQDVTVQGDHAVGGKQDIKGSQTIGGNSEVDGSISAGKESSFKGGAIFGEFSAAGGTIQGAHVDDRGFGKFAGLKSDYFEIFELIYNIQTARKGEEIFSDAATVESVEGLAMYDEPIRGEYDDNDEFFKGECQLKLRSEREGYKHTFRKWDVIYGRVNNIGESGEYAQGGIFWGRVAFEPENEEDNLTLTVQIYADTETGSINISPTAHMVVARRGNKDDVTRQNTFYISTEEGNITQLLGVTKPLIDVTNTGAVLGLLPKHLRDYVESKGYTINAYAPYLYVRGLIAQDFMQLDYLGRPIRTDNYRGEWNADVAASNTEYYRMTTTTYDTVTYGGSLWECVVEKSNADPPSEDNESWRLRVAKGEQGQSGDSKIYELKPNVNIIYLHDKDNASIDYISLVVGVTNTDGYAEITDSASLAEHGFKVQYSYDGETSGRTDLTLPESVIFESEDGEYALSTEDESDIALEITIEDITKIEDNITFYLVDSEGNDVDTVVIPVVRDGIQGKSGPLPYPCGVWSNAVASLDDTPYVCTDDSTVYVLWPNDEETGNFYVRTSNPMRYTTNADGTKNYYTPADDWAMGGLVGWRPMTKFQAINVSMLMADWAKFGNSDGGVFYGHHLFSSMGLTKTGEEESYTKDMFNSEGELSGTHVPHLFLDFKNGGAKFGKLSESFYSYFDNSDTSQEGWTSIMKMKLNSYHNISHFPIIPFGASYDDSRNHKPIVITLPKSSEEWAEDGTHVTILHQFDFEHSKGPSSEKYRNSAILVCADDIYFDPNNYDDNENNGYQLTKNVEESPEGWMVWKGRRCKFCLLAPSSMLKLRSSISNGVITWFVENGEAFETLDSRIVAYKDFIADTKEDKDYIDVSATLNSGSLSHGDTPIIGSPQFNMFNLFEDGVLGTGVYHTEWIIDASGGEMDNTIKKFNFFHTPTSLEHDRNEENQL